VAVAAMHLGDALPGGHAQGGEQAGSAVADIVMGAPGEGRGQDRQGRGGAVQRLGVARARTPARSARSRLAHEPVPPLGHRSGPDPSRSATATFGRTLGTSQHDPGHKVSAWALVRRRAQRSRICRSYSVNTNDALGLPRSAIPPNTIAYTTNLSTQDTS
jgi:hypothetical protein